jgi:L-threonylcarbamoyladenylate synthase
MDTRLLDATDPATRSDAVVEAARLLRNGELVAFPTETVYGLGASALDAGAIARVFEVKGRPADNPLIVHVADLATMSELAEVDDRARSLVLAFMPGPLTLVLRAREGVPPIARAGLATIAVRIPDHVVALVLLREAGPLVGPSANLSGRPSPTTAGHVLDDLSGRIPAVLDGGACRVGIESTVLDLTGEIPRILRPGMIDAAQIEAVLGVPVAADAGGSAHRSPGTRYRHYAPRAAVRLAIDASPPAVEPGRRMVLTTRRHLDAFPRVVTRILSEDRLYSQLRSADEIGFEEIVIYAEPGELAAGLLDRVTRAAGADAGAEGRAG